MDTAIEREHQLMKQKEDRLRQIFRTLEKQTELQERKKQDWIDKAIEIEQKKR